LIHSQNYRGRFAPSPSGDLHFGSLVTAMASYADALFHQGTWIVRIDDIDTPRVLKGATSSILNTLEKLGFKWHERIYYQSENRDLYTQIINELYHQDIFYRCYCTRKEIQAINSSMIYSGTCKTKDKISINKELKQNFSLRVGIPLNQQNIRFIDSIQGKMIYQLKTLSGDFIVNRSDNIISYHLSFVIDNHMDNITHIIRAYDLLDSTPKQILLQQLLSYPIPQYAHIPIITNADGIKLSKSCNAPAVETNIKTLINAAKILGQTLDNDIIDATIDEFWQNLVFHWDSSKIPKVDKLKESL